jgi:hypothetical protein
MRLTHHHARKRHLLAKAHKPATRAKYNAGVRLFIRWCKLTNAPAVSTVDDLDELLCDFIHDLYDDGGSMAAGRAAYLGIEAVFPRLRGCFKLARQAIRGWENGSPPSAAVACDRRDRVHNDARRARAGRRCDATFLPLPSQGL